MLKVYHVTDAVNPETVESQIKENIEYIYLPLNTEEEIIENCKDAEALVTIYEPVGKKAMDALENLKYICVASIGFNLIDLDYAKEKGIVVSNNPNYCIEEVADHTIGQTINLVRKINRYDNDIKNNKHWKFDAFGNSLKRISKLTIGVIGFGSIAKEVIKRFKGFNCEILVYDPFVNKEAIEEFGINKVELDELLKVADVITIHVPLNDSTKNMINDETIDKMENHPIIINNSRGGLIDLEALTKGLKIGKISGAALDVLDSENPNLDELEIVTMDNALLTPHAAFYSMDAKNECDTNVGVFLQSYVDGEYDNIPWVIKPEKED